MNLKHEDMKIVNGHLSPVDNRDGKPVPYELTTMEN
jgi:hypothetical protein